MTVFRSKYPSIHIPEHVSLPDYLLTQIKRFPAHLVALQDVYTDEQYTYGDVAELIPKTARAFVRRGVQTGDRVCIFADNSIDYPVVILGAALAGAVVCFYNHLYTPEELAPLLTDADPVLAVTTTAALPRLLETTREGRCPSLRYTFLFDGPDSFVKRVKKEADLQEVLPVLSPKTDVCFMPYSSGTTGVPKGVMLTHYNLVANCLQYREICKEDPNYVIGQPLLLVVPMFHVSGLVFGCCYSMSDGKTVYVMKKFDARLYLSLISKFKMDTMGVVPPMLVYLNKSGLFEEYDLSCLKNIVIGAAPLDKKTEQETLELIPTVEKFSQAYGMTESTCIGFSNTKINFKAGSVGVPLPNSEVVIVDVDSGRRLGVNEPGELWYRGPMVMKGYWKKPAATSSTIDEQGWLHTGDIGYVDNDGFFYIVDRVKELIKYKGYQVAPAELEGILLAHPDVADVAVLGVPDESAGELPRAYIVLKENRRTGAEQIAQYLAERVSPQKKLRGGVRFVKEIPKNPSGKILRRVLKKKMRSEEKETSTRSRL